MAKNTEKRAQTRAQRLAAREEAQRQLEAQERKERTIQMTIGVVVVFVILALIGIGGFFIARNYAATHQTEEQRTSQAASLADEAYKKVEAVKVKPKNATKDGGFVLSKNGVNKPVSGVPTIEEYMDFICPACGTMNRSTDSVITPMVQAGQVNFAVHPAAFLNSSSSDKYSSRSAAFVAYVLDNEPDKALALISKLFSTDVQPSEGSAYVSVSNAKLVEIAKSAGVSDKVAQAAAKGTYTEWIDAVSAWHPYRSELWNTSGQFKGQMTTPTLRINSQYWDYNTLISKAEVPNYGSLLLKSIGLDQENVGNASILPSIGEGKPIDLTK